MGDGKAGCGTGEEGVGYAHADGEELDDYDADVGVLSD